MRPWLPLLLAGSILSAQSQQASEYQLKLTILEKLTQFIEWPAGGETERRASPFVLGVIGRSPFGDELEARFLTRELKDRPVVIHYFRRPQDLGPCDMLYICASEQEHLGAILAWAQTRPVLTIGDSAGFAERGVMVNLVRAQDRISFEVNIAEAKRVGIRLSSALVRMARVFP